nr:MAG TPA: hypothetical protein [Caudoviricetes sp.]
MYLLFRYHDILPSRVREMGRGERTILKAFISQELQDRAEEFKRMYEG